MKKEILKTLKIVFLSLIFSAGFSFAAWVAMPANPVPPTAPNTNIPTSINVGSASQVKSGGLATGPLAVFGQSQMNGDVNIKNDLGGGNLYISGRLGIGMQPTEKVDVNGKIKISSLAHPSGIFMKVCANTANGEISLCPLVQPTGNINFTIPTTTATWAVPFDVTTATFEAWGAGAGGGGGVVGPGINMVDGAGGGGGGYYKTILTVTPGQTYSITVGVHGNGGNGSTSTAGPGTAGGLSKVVNASGTVVALGNGGLAVNTGATSTTPGTGGIGGAYSGTGGTGAGGVSFSGLNPTTNPLVSPDNCSNGGNGANGDNGGRGGLRLPVSNPLCSNTSVNGSTGLQPGGGGGGGGWSLNLGLSLVPGNGGNGADGKVRISW